MKKTPFSAKDLAEYKALLEEKKESLLKDIKSQAEELTEEKDDSGDVVDQAANISERNISLSLTNTEKEILNDIDEALGRIEDKTYGICIDTEIVIGTARLKAIPEAKRTIEAQGKFDALIKKKKSFANQNL